VKVGVIVFPGSNCDRDLADAFRYAGAQVSMIWHKESKLPDGLDLVAIPGGFSFGDYLRCGAIAARSPVSRAVVDHASRGGYVLGICNGFQVLTETGMLPGALMRNSGLKFVCRSVPMRVETTDSVFTSGYGKSTTVHYPVAHHDGNYSADEDLVARLKGEDRVAFRYESLVNGSVDDIAGVLSENRRILGLMPHPERAADAQTGATDGGVMFAGLVKMMQLA